MIRTIKIVILFLVAAFLAAPQSCSKLDRLTTFHMNFTDTVVLPSTIGLNLPFNMFTPPITTNSEDVFAVNDTRKDLIEEIKIESLDLTLFDPESMDFSFLNSIEIYLDADTLDATLVAWKYDIKNDVGDTLSLEVTDEDLTIYLLQDQMQLKITTVTDKIPMSDASIRIDAGFFINAKILGI